MVFIKKSAKNLQESFFCEELFYFAAFKYYFSVFDFMQV